ncbi:glycoside hydrolase family 16 protein, partial [Nocardioides sp.]|uniref:glycoside hydrolase family 16 protein n=1 Tax=Nocardioides sp. TaxID=35761 RepID=UPI0027368785
DMRLPTTGLVCGALVFGASLTATSTRTTTSTPVTSPTTGQLTTVAHGVQKVTLTGPKKRYAGQRVKLKGVADARRVRIQRKTNRGWVTERRTKVRSNKRYAARVKPRPGRTKYRAVTRHGRSKKHVVRVVKAPPPAPTDACGTQPLKADGSRWQCTFNDEFDGTALDRTQWKVQTNQWSGTLLARACTRDDPRNISVSGGTLQLTVREGGLLTECPGGLLPSQYSSGSISTHRLFGQQYGRFEARVRTMATNEPGLQEAFWMWPDDRYPSSTTWPEAGEIDVAETYSYYPKLAIPYLHYTKNDNGGPIPGVNTAWDCLADRGVFNTYTLIWGPSRIEILVNGKTCLVNTSGDPAFRKPYILLLTVGLGRSLNAKTSRTPLPATTHVDYVRVWK